MNKFIACLILLFSPLFVHGLTLESFAVRYDQGKLYVLNQQKLPSFDVTPANLVTSYVLDHGNFTNFGEATSP